MNASSANVSDSVGVKKLGHRAFGGSPGSRTKVSSVPGFHELRNQKRARRAAASRLLPATTAQLSSKRRSGRLKSLGYLRMPVSQGTLQRGSVPLEKAPTSYERPAFQKYQVSSLQFGLRTQNVAVLLSSGEGLSDVVRTAARPEAAIRTPYQLS